MRVSNEGRAFIARWEGFRATRYLDAAGLPTIGYGHLLTARELATMPSTIDHDTALSLLEADLRHVEATLARFIHRPLTQNQFDALSSFTFNLGAGTLQRSTLRRMVNRGAFLEASEQFQRFIWAGGRKSLGLLRRRRAEAIVFIK